METSFFDCEKSRHLYPLFLEGENPDDYNYNIKTIKKQYTSGLRFARGFFANDGGSIADSLEDTKTTELHA